MLKITIFSSKEHVLKDYYFASQSRLATGENVFTEGQLKIAQLLNLSFCPASGNVD